MSLMRKMQWNLWCAGLIGLCAWGWGGQGAKEALASPTTRPTLELRLQQMKSPQWRVRYDAMGALAKQGKQKGWATWGKQSEVIYQQIVKHAQKDTYFWVRVQAVSVLGALGTRGVLVVIDRLHKDPLSQVRHAAAKALGAMASHPGPFLGGHEKAVLAALKTAMKDRAIRLTAGQAWEQITGNPLPMLGIMMETLKHPRSMIRSIMSRAFGRLSPRARMFAVPLLVRALKKSDSSWEDDAITALVAIGKESLPALRKLQASGDARMKALANRAIGQIKDAKK